MALFAVFISTGAVIGILTIGFAISTGAVIWIFLTRFVRPEDVSGDNAKSVASWISCAVGVNSCLCNNPCRVFADFDIFADFIDHVITLCSVLILIPKVEVIKNTVDHQKIEKRLEHINLGVTPPYSCRTEILHQFRLKCTLAKSNGVVMA